MANMPSEFRQKIIRLETNFTVSFIIFNKYHVIFTELFQNPIDDLPKQHRSRKQRYDYIVYFQQHFNVSYFFCRNVPCTPSRIFEFCWMLFVCIKGEYAACSDDIVTSFHLLLACCDLAFSNVLLSDKRYLLNVNFAGKLQIGFNLIYMNYCCFINFRTATKF